MDIQIQEFLKSLLAKLDYYKLTAQDLLDYENSLKPATTKSKTKK